MYYEEYIFSWLGMLPCINAADLKIVCVILWSNTLTKLNVMQSFLFLLFLPSFHRQTKHIIFVWHISFCAFMYLCIHCVIIVTFISVWHKSSYFLCSHEFSWGHIWDISNMLHISQDILIYVYIYIYLSCFWKIGLNEKFI